MEGEKDADTADKKALRGEVGTKSIVVSSNLRRCLATGAIGLWSRLQRTHERIYVMSSMQECSRNVDTLAVGGASALVTCIYVLCTLRTHISHDQYATSFHSCRRRTACRICTR
jgi:hypothetical protein